MSESFRPTPFLLGICSGLRTTLGLNVLAVAGGRSKLRSGVAVALAAEVLTDKLPRVPSRLATGPLIGRLVTGATVGAVSGRRSEPSGTAAALSGFVGAGLASFAGARWRAVAARRFGVDLPGALLEDAVAFAAAATCVLLLRRAAAVNGRAVPAAGLAQVTVLPVGTPHSLENRRTEVR